MVVALPGRGLKLLVINIHEGKRQEPVREGEKERVRRGCLTERGKISTNSRTRPNRDRDMDIDNDGEREGEIGI